MVIYLGKFIDREFFRLISMKRIAQEVGVSRATVSYVLNGKYGDGLKISEPVVRKVQLAAERLGYVPNELVSSVVTGKSRVIAVISSFPDFMMQMIKGCVEEAARHDCLIKLIPRKDDINHAIMQAVKFRVAGIFATSLPAEVIDQIDPRFFDFNIPSIGLTHNTGRMAFDQGATSCLGTEYLISMGHRRILFFGTNAEVTSERAAGYREAMRRHHLKEEILMTDFSPSTEQRIYEKVIRLHPSAVQCCNDHLAMNLMHACYCRKLFVPEYFSILGFGNISGSAESSPHLTTVSEPYYETGVIMFRQIYQLISNGKVTPVKDLVGSVIERESVTVADEGRKSRDGHKPKPAARRDMPALK
jgi:DNA-binding LacI/PurR family transcriptional regulator